jgi:large subunit ribosomal protein L10
MTKPADHISQKKKEQVAIARKLIENNPIVGIVNMERLPAQQLQTMKEKLRDKVTLFMTKKRLLRIAIKEASKKNEGIEKLDEHLKGMPALLVTKDNPFLLYKTIKKNKSPAPAKGGQTAPKDIIVKAGPTSFAPGPIIGELGALKIKAGIDGGKVVIKEDSLVCKEGDTISETMAAILQRLDIKPMEVGLDILGIFEKGTIYTKKILDVDEDVFLARIREAAQNALNLAVDTGIPTTESTTLLLQKASREAQTVAKDANILTKETVPSILAKAEAEARVLNTKTH